MSPHLPARRRTAALLAVTLAGLALWLTATSTGSASPSTTVEGADRPRVIHLTGMSAGREQIDLGTPGPSLGDEQVFSEDLRRDDQTHVGTVETVCQITRLEAATRTFTAQCSATIVLRKGQITTQGVVSSTQLESQPFRQAVTGGTGAYRRARGELEVDESGPEPARFTLTVFD